MYKAYVTKIFTRELPGADNLLIGDCKGYQVIVGKDIVNGSLGVLFEQGGQLSEEFATKHDLIRRKNPDGTPAGGMFNPNRKVKAIKLRGARSDGFFVPLSYFEYTGFDTSSLKEGDQFDELNGKPICNKFVTAATLRAANQNNKKKKTHRETLMMPKHIDTGHFLREGKTIPAGALLYISSKCHGTSMRLSHALETTEPEGVLRSFIDLTFGINEKVGKYLLNKFSKKEWRHLNGSRNVILEKRTANSKGYYEDENFRFKVTEGIALHKGEMLYGEIVGWTGSCAPIMKPQDTSKLKDKKITKRFGEKMIYKYGCPEGTQDLYIYRITQLNEDGFQVDLSWPQIEKRCRELGLKTVPTIEFRVYDGDFEKLKEDVDFMVNGESGSDAIPDTIDPSHIREGVVIRAESNQGITWMKHKSWLFGVLENYIKDDDSFVDIEESS